MSASKQGLAPGLYDTSPSTPRFARRSFSRIHDLRPRLAMLAALLDDWAERSILDYLPDWYDDDDHFADDGLFSRRLPIGLRRSYSARKPDDCFDLTVDGDNPFLGFGRTRKLLGRKPMREPEDPLSYRRQHFEPTSNDERTKFTPSSGKERQVPVQIQRSQSVDRTRQPVQDVNVQEVPRERKDADECGARKVVVEGADRPARTVLQDAPSDVPMVPQSELEEEKRKVRQLREENLRLKAVIANIQEVNKRWQAFNGDRQTYIQRLLTTIEEQQTQINACLDALRDSQPYNESTTPATPSVPPTPPAVQTPTPAPSPRTVHIPVSVPQDLPRDVAPSSSSRCSQLQDEAETRLRRLQREVAQLQKRLDDAKNEHRETISLLQMQVEAHKDDWEAERREKHAAVASKEQAETQLRELSKKLEHEKTPPASESQNDLNARSGTAASRARASSSQRDETSPRRSFIGDVVVDRKEEPVRQEPVRQEPPASPMSPPAVPDRDRSQYSFNSAGLRDLRDDVYVYESCGGSRRPVSPCLSDALTPTPTPTPGAAPPHGYPIEVTGSSSSLASGPVPNVSMPLSSRDSSPDPDISMCSDITLDCSPPSPQPTPIQGTLTVGFNSDGLASVTSFRTRPLSPVAPSPDFADLSDLGADGGSYWAQGAPTNSCEDVICPSCGEVFPPIKHLQFLDHFEECESKPSHLRAARN